MGFEVEHRQNTNWHPLATRVVRQQQWELSYGTEHSGWNYVMDIKPREKSLDAGRFKKFSQKTLEYRVKISRAVSMDDLIDWCHQNTRQWTFRPKHNPYYSEFEMDNLIFSFREVTDAVAFKFRFGC